jgi:hypothetical protein
MLRAIEAVPIQLNEPLARFLLRPEIFMNPATAGEASATEFRIGAWGDALLSDRSSDEKDRVTRIMLAKSGSPTPVEVH